MVEDFFNLFKNFFAGLALLLVSAAHGFEIQSQQDTLHFEFPGLSSWDYQIKKTKDKNSELLILVVPALTQEQIYQVKQIQSPLVKLLRVNPLGPDGKIQIDFQVIAKDLEVFDYFTDEPKRLIVDIYKNSASPSRPKSFGPEKAMGKMARPALRSSVVADFGPMNALPKKKSTQKKRTPASDGEQLIFEQKGEFTAGSENPKKGIFDGSDPDFLRFQISDFDIKEEAIIKSTHGSYIDFPMLKLASDLLEQFISEPVVYEIKGPATDEVKMAQLLKTLFDNKRYQVFLKTVDWFYEKYPKSEYDETIKLMWGDALFALWNETGDAKYFELAQLRYTQFLDHFPNHRLAERTSLLLGFASMDRGDILSGLQQFTRFLDKYPQSKYRDRALMAQSDSYLKLNKFAEARKILEELEAKATIPELKIKATFVKPDVMFLQKKYNEAIFEYQKAIEKYPAESSKDFPNAYYNTALAQFHLKDYKQSLKSYIQFLKKFPSHENAGYSMTRIGEILEILGAPKKQVLGAYLETFFRYGETQNSLVARLRILGEQMSKMKPVEVEKTLKELRQLVEKSNLPEIKEFSTLMFADGFSGQKNYDQAIDLLVKFYQKNPTSSQIPKITQKIVGNINLKIEDLVQKGQFIDALKFHNQYANTWLKNSDRIDTQFNIGKAFEQAGLFDSAQKYFEETVNRLFALKGQDAEKERRLFENLPTRDQAHLRLSQVLLQQKQFSKAYDAMKEIQDPLKMTELEQIERIQLGAILLDKKGDTETAVRFIVDLIKEWKGIPALAAEPFFLLGQYELKQNKTKEALKSFLKIDQLVKDSTTTATASPVSADTHAGALEKVAQIYLEQNQIIEAQKTIQQLLNTFDGKRPLASWRYQLGELYFKQGETQKATEIWKALDQPQSQFWNKLAMEQLQNTKWADDNKKYLQRSPASAKKE